MIGSSDSLNNIRRYTGLQHIRIANGSTLPITTVGDLGLLLIMSFLSSNLSTNLVSIGQLVDNKCDVCSYALVALCRIRGWGRYRKGA